MKIQILKNKKSTLIKGLMVLVFGMVGEASWGQTTVAYTQQTGDYDQSLTTNGSGGIYNNGITEVGMWMNGDNSGNSFAGNVLWKTFRVGSATSNTARSLQVGDEFRITVSTKGFYYGTIGVSLNSGALPTSSWANRSANSRIRIQQDGSNFGIGNPGSWYYSNGSATSFSIIPTGSYVDYVITVRITAPDLCNVTLNGTTFNDIALGGTSGAAITHFSIYMSDDRAGIFSSPNRGDSYWKQTTTVVNQGSLPIGSSNNAVSISSVIPNGLAANSTSTVSNNSIIKSGSGTVTLSNANTYTGTTTINGGTLSISADNNLGTAPVSVTPASITLGGGILAFTTGFTLNTNRGITTTASTNSTIDVASGQTLTYGGVITGGSNGNISKTGTGMLTLSGAGTYGGLTVSNGIVRLNGTANTQLLGNVTVNSGATLRMAAANQFGTSVTPPFITVNGTFDATDNGGGNNNQNIAVQGNGAITLGSSTLTIASGAGPDNFSGIISGTGSVTKAGSGIQVLSGANTYSGGTTLTAGTLRLGTGNTGSVGSITNSPIGTGSLSLNGGTLTSNGVTDRTILNAYTLGGDITLGDATNNGVLTFSAAGTLSGNRQVTTASPVTFSGAVGETGGASRLTKAGSSALTLSAANTYTGGTTLSAGTLNIANASALGTTAGTFTINGGTIDNTSGSSLNLSNYPMTWGGNFTFTGTHDLNLGTGNIARSGDVTVTVSANNLTVGGDIAGGTNKIVKAGVGALALSGASSFTGNLEIDNGDILIATGGSWSSTETYIGNGVQLTNVCRLLFANSGLSSTRNITINNGNSNTRYIGSTHTSGNSTFSGTITNNSTSGVVLTSATGGSTTFSGIISGSNPVIKDGAGAIILSAANTYTGSTIIRNGTLSTGAANALPVGSSAGTIQSTTTSGNTLTLGAFSIGTGTTAANSAGQLDLDVNTIINLPTSDANAYSYYFKASNGQTWSATTITINNWVGTAGSTAGTGSDARRIFIGSGATGLNSTQLAKISFTGYTAGAQILSTGEIVPLGVPVITAISALPNNGTSTNAYNGSTITITGSNLDAITAISMSTGGTVSTLGSFGAGNYTFTLPTGYAGTITLTNANGIGAASASSIANIGFISTAPGGDWTSTSSWLGGTVPSVTTDLVTIASSSQITLNTNDTIAGLTINSGATFTASDNNARALTLSRTASATTLVNLGGTWVNGIGGSTLNFIGIGSSADVLHTVSGTFNLNNVVINKPSGTFNVGVAFGLNGKLASGGKLTIGNGGYLSSIPVDFYTANGSSTLEFSNSGGYTVGASDATWPSTNSPANINITLGTVVLNSTRTASGNLNISGGGLTLGVPLTINGNWTRATSATFTPSTFSVTLSGTTDQIISVTGGGTSSQYGLIINKATGNVLLDNSVGNLTNLTITNSLTLSNGQLNLNGRTLTLNSGSNITRGLGSLSANPIFSGTVNITYTTGGITTGSELPSSTSALTNLTFSHTSGTITLDKAITVNGTLTTSAGGTLADGGFTLTTLGESIVHNGTHSGAGTIRLARVGSDQTITGTGTFQNLENTITTAGNMVVGSNFNIAGNFTNSSRGVRGLGNTITFTGTGNLVNNANMFGEFGGTTLSLVFDGNTTLSGSTGYLDAKNYTVNTNRTLDCATIGLNTNSSAPAKGIITINGTLRTANTAGLWNGSSNDPTIRYSSDNFQTLNIASGSTIEYNAAGAQTVSSSSGIFTGYGNLTISGSGVKTLSGATLTVAGTTRINTGADLRLNPSASISYASQVMLNGGTLSTTSIAATRTFTTSSTLNLASNSTITLGTGNHTLTFGASDGISWTAGRTLTIYGWSGGYNGTAASASNPKLFIGSSLTGLTALQLEQIVFNNGSSNFGATILSTGEVVPTPYIASYYYQGGTNGMNALTNWTTGPTGTGNNPTSFTAADQTFNIIQTVSTASNSGTFTISGSGSKIVLGNAGYGSRILTIASGKPINATIDIVAPGGGSGNVLEISDATSPTLGSLHSSANVTYNATGNQNIQVKSYRDLTLGGSGVKTLTGATGVTGTLTVPTGVTLDFGNNVVSGTGDIDIQSGATVITAHTSGLNGSNTTTGGLSTYNTGASYSFNGGSSQVFGSALPATVNNLTINNGNNNLSLGESRTINGALTLTSGKLVIGAGNTLTLNGGLTCDATNSLISTATSNITLTGAAKTLFFDASNNNLRNLAITSTNTMTLGNALNITGGTNFGVVTVGSGATLNTGSGFLTLRSTDLGTASIGTSLGTITGSVNVERFVSGSGRRWRFLSSPVTSATVADWMTQFYVTGPCTAAPTGGLGSINDQGWHTSQANIDYPGPYNVSTNNKAVRTTSIRTYNESAAGNNTNLNAGWADLTGTSQALTPGQGFRTFVRGPIGTTGQLNGTVTSQASVTLALSGTVNQGNVTPTLTNNTQGWNLLGNPYACGYDFNAQFDAGQGITNINPTVYVYDATSNGYVSYNASSNTPSGLASGVIPSGAGFFVQASGAPSFQFREAYKTTAVNPTGVHKTDVSTVDFGIKYYKDSTESDYMVVKMFEGATMNNEMFDTKKVYNENLNLSAYGTDSVQLTASCIPFVTNETRVKLNVEATEIGTYKFDFKNMDNFQSNITVSLF
ncbi:MAG: autotransporter-associated beta strand repeat-containing protein, partial [Bacteroidia bacterium]|nr:autotransporter-associated beta strand repeat-containing protein [Bacteroidia bacterium]